MACPNKKMFRNNLELIYAFNKNLDEKNEWLGPQLSE